MEKQPLTSARPTAVLTFSSTSSSSSSSDRLSDEGSDDVLFVASSVLAGFTVLLVLLLGFRFRELACVKPEGQAVSFKSRKRHR